MAFVYFAVLLFFVFSFTVIWAGAITEDLDDNGKQQLTPRADNIMPGGLSGLTSILAALGIIKFKIVLSLITAFFIVALLSKLLGGIGTVTCSSLGIACPPGVAAFSSYSNYNPDYNNFDLYRGKSSNPNILDALSKKIDVMDISFRIFGIEDEACRKKFVCMADNEAKGNPVFEFALKLLGSNLNKYRDSDTRSADRKDCRQLYQQCTTILPDETGYEVDTLKRVKSYRFENGENSI